MTITINGKKVELLFGMRAVEKFFSSAEMVEGKKLSTSAMIELVFAGIENSYYRERKTLDVKFSDVYDWVEEKLNTEEGKNELGSIYREFEDSQAVKSLSAKSKKKKPISTT